MSRANVWKCLACGSFVRGINWGEWMKGKEYHKTPTGGECRVTNVEQVVNLPEGTPVVASLPSVPPVPTKPVTDDTDEFPALHSDE